jgi:hypothetical protein
LSLKKLLSLSFVLKNAAILYMMCANAAHVAVQFVFAQETGAVFLLNFYQSFEAHINIYCCHSFLSSK